MKFDLQLYDAFDLQKDNNELLNLIVDQVKKDAALLALEVNDPVNIDFHSVLIWIQNFVETVQRDDQNDFINFLYRIDIDDKFIQKATKHWPELDDETIIARLIFVRQFAKIKMRQGYSKG